MSKNADKIEQKFTEVDISLGEKATKTDLAKKTDVNGDHKGTWNGFTPSQVDIGVTAMLNAHEEQLAQNKAQLDSQYLNVKFPEGTGLTPLKGDGSNEQEAFLAIINYAKEHLPIKLFFPEGTYGYTDLGNIAYDSLTLEGASDKDVVFKCLNTAPNHIALDVNGFRNNTEMDQFVKRFNISNITIEGNNLTDKILRLKGIVLSNFQDIILREGNPTSGRSLSLESCMSNTFVRVVSSTTIDPNMINKPYYGLYMEYGYRGTATPGSCTNNTFINCYFDGFTKAGYLDKADQNTFVGCAFQKNANRGLEITDGNRWNTLINTAFESNTNDDIYDKGRSTQFINCYALNKVILEGSLAKVQGGEFGVIQNNGYNNVFENIRVNFKRNGLGAGFVDNGIATSWKNIYDLDTTVASYIYPYRARTPITVGASPFTWNNTTGKYVEIILQTGTISRVLQKRKGDNVLLPTQAPNKFIIAPNDSVEFTYTEAPSLSYSIMNGF